MVWEVEGTNEFAAWYWSLNLTQQQALDEAVAKLEEFGPALGRPLVDTLKTSPTPT